MNSPLDDKRMGSSEYLDIRRVKSPSRSCAFVGVVVDDSVSEASRSMGHGNRSLIFTGKGGGEKKYIYIILYK